MVFAAALLAFVPLLLRAVPAQSYILVNTATNLYIQDHNVTSHDEVGNPIVGAPYNATRPKAQSGWGFFGTGFDAATFGKTRLINGTTNPIKTLVTGLPGEALSAEVYGSLFKLVHPTKGAPEIWAFLADVIGPAPLAVTVGKAFEPLTLQPYHSSDPKQHWLIYPEATPASALADPGKHLASPVTNPTIVSAGSAKPWIATAV
ncbi:hypothetical protein AURDEDRAFT_174610 [Auricularia subglabra TFB-10046 SS5]|uniref:Uncharacterized protein n=1 Tax=Auricularia subglabra (strain TFB-10046 / SS5) TaxID=717982 RepID=J0D990_AURST|nr:hypothetical protein AURDEDRAFT_174610 [Auricularia subglabra TFB-10046 SS5]